MALNTISPQLKSAPPRLRISAVACHVLLWRLEHLLRRARFNDLAGVLAPDAA